MYINPTPEPAEWLHHKKCLAAAMIEAIENHRDLEYTFATDLEFTLWAQDGGPLNDARLYLNEGMKACECPEGYQG